MGYGGRKRGPETRPKTILAGPWPSPDGRLAASWGDLEDHAKAPADVEVRNNAILTSCTVKARPSLFTRTRITACSDPIDLRLAPYLYQDHHMLLLTLAGHARRAAGHRVGR